MFSALRRFVIGRLGAVPREELAAVKKTIGRSEARMVGTVETSARQIAKRLDRLEQRIAALADQTSGLDAIARTGRLRKIDDNVDALVRHAFLDGDLPDPQALLARRFRGLSQNEEDGIIIALFHRIGTTNRRFVEVGAGVNGGNSGFLAKECGWTGLMIEIDPARVASLRRRFAPAVSVVEARVTRENINEIISAHGLDGDVDVISIDIDGMDYWVWEQLEVCRARLVIVEYNPFLGAERSVVVPYDPQFDRHRFDIPRAAYYGASLPALISLARRKGYRLVMVEPRGIDAFFVRDDIPCDLPTLEAASLPIASDLAVEFGPGGIFPIIDRAGLALVDVQ